MLPGDNRFTEVFQSYCGCSKRHHSHQILAPMPCPERCIRPQPPDIARHTLPGSSLTDM